MEKQSVSIVATHDEWTGDPADLFMAVRDLIDGSSELDPARISRVELTVPEGGLTKDGQAMKWDVVVEGRPAKP